MKTVKFFTFKSRLRHRAVTSRKSPRSFSYLTSSTKLCTHHIYISTNILRFCYRLLMLVTRFVGRADGAQDMSTDGKKRTSECYISAVMKAGKTMRNWQITNCLNAENNHLRLATLYTKTTKGEKREIKKLIYFHLWSNRTKVTKVITDRNIRRILLSRCSFRRKILPRWNSIYYFEMSSGRRSYESLARTNEIFVAFIKAKGEKNFLSSRILPCSYHIFRCNDDGAFRVPSLMLVRTKSNSRNDKRDKYIMHSWILTRVTKV